MLQARLGHNLEGHRFLSIITGIWWGGGGGACARQSDRNKCRRIAFAIACAITRRGMNLEKSSCRARASPADRDRLFVKSNGQSQSGDFSRLFPAHRFFPSSRHAKDVISLSAFLSFFVVSFCTVQPFSKGAVNSFTS